MQKILAIDDEPDLLRLLERIIIDKTNYQITICSNSLEIPEILDTNEFDVIITDLKMPGLDGIDIIKMIKERKRFEVVIMITAFGTLESAMEAISLGVFDYITKPFRKEQLLFTIERAMKYQRHARLVNQFTYIMDQVPYSNARDKFEKMYFEYRLTKNQGDINKTKEETEL